MSLLQNQEIISFLKDHASDTETSRSTYWNNEVPNFSIAADGSLDGSCAAGSVSTKRGLFYDAAHWVLQTPWRYLGRNFPRFKTHLATGHQIAEFQQRQFTEDMMRQVLTISLVEQHVDLKDPAMASCVIGDGYGVLSSMLLKTFPARKVILVNLTKTLLADLTFLSRAIPGVRIALAQDEEEMKTAFNDPDINAIAVRADDAGLIRAAPIGAAFNLVSMHEMNPEIIAGYFKILRTNQADATAFYCCNRINKVLADGTVTEFFQYPWHPDDRFTVDEKCPWLRMSYSAQPPFWWPMPKTNYCQHRIAYLAKPTA